MLARLGYREITTYHLNEGHASLVPVALLSERLGGTVADASAADIAAVRERCVFTTHTPVPAGHDRFSPKVVAAILGPELAEGLRAIGSLEDGTLNMTVLGMYFSRFINGVAQRHGEVARAMFPRYRIDAITNGVHVSTWVAPSTALLFDRHLPCWREDNAMLRYATGIPLGEVRAAHADAKLALLEEVSRRRSVRLDPAALTLGVARRATPYKRNDLLLSRPDALRAIVDRVGPLQVLYSGKAHPRDQLGKTLIERVNAAAEELNGDVTVVYLEDYGMSLAALLVAGVDVWVNNPVAPHEASGTSGMKSAVNGVPSLSILDGWWVEGHVEGVTGWAVGSDLGAGVDLPIGDPEADGDDATELHRVLADVVAPLYYGRPDAFAAVCRFAMALNGSFFTTQRMVREYAARAYGLDPRPLCIGLPPLSPRPSAGRAPSSRRCVPWLTAAATRPRQPSASRSWSRPTSSPMGPTNCEPRSASATRTKPNGTPLPSSRSTTTAGGASSRCRGPGTTGSASWPQWTPSLVGAGTSWRERIRARRSPSSSSLALNWSAGWQHEPRAPIVSGSPRLPTSLSEPTGSSWRPAGSWRS